MKARTRKRVFDHREVPPVDLPFAWRQSRAAARERLRGISSRQAANGAPILRGWAMATFVGMLEPREVHVSAISLDRFAPLLNEQQRADVERAAAWMRGRMVGRSWWNVNSTPRGGGVAEMLPSLTAYGRGAGVDLRWLVIEGTPEFFRVTKRLHHALHGSVGDGSPLGPAERRLYDTVLEDNAEELLALVKRNDVVLLHDPQTAGLARSLRDKGAIVLWRCHIGSEQHNEETERGWKFIARDLLCARRCVFSRAAYIPEFIRGLSVVVEPAIDVFNAKNQPMDANAAKAILAHTGLIDAPLHDAANVYLRRDGVPSRVDRLAELVRLGRGPTPEVPLVVQVSRWDPLKDPIGVMHGFCRLLRNRSIEAQLILAGPSVTAVRDDPEGASTLDQVIDEWRELPDSERHRIHLACLPMVDVEENAAIVNALQRHATIVVQKSIEEGFGLTVLEAMWKARPVVATAVGGIKEQINSGEQGILIDNPHDLDAFANALKTLLADPPLARRMGESAAARIRQHFLATRQLIDYTHLLADVEGQEQPPHPPQPPQAPEAHAHA